jgi:predicted PurR-regulated permease PerM
MGEFKRFVEHEHSEKKKEKIKKAQETIGDIFEYISENIGNIFSIIVGCFVIFSILYCIFADGSEVFDTKITKIQRVEKSYVNDADTLYVMNVVSKERNFSEAVNLTKEEYVTYSNAYAKGIDTYKYTDYNALYLLCSFFLALVVLLFFIFGGS